MVPITVVVVMMVLDRVVAIPHPQPVDYTGWQVLRLTMLDGEQEGSWLDMSANESPHDINILTRNKLQGTSDVAISPSALQAFTSHLAAIGATYSSLVTDLGKLVNEEQPSRTRAEIQINELSYQQLLTYQQITEYVNWLASQHPDLVIVEEAGRSVEGRAIPVLIITSPNSQTNKSVIFIEAGVHAREWVSPLAALKVASEVVSSPDLTRHLEWRIMPLVNPDGYLTSWTTERLWRKNRAVRDGVKCVGVDINRNFGYHWRNDSRPCSETYQGPEPFSEPETRAVRDAVLQVANRTQIFMSLHSYGQLIMYPWAHTSTLRISNRRILVKLARGMARAISNHNPVRYVVGTPAEVLYSATGSSMDWAAGDAGVPLSFSMELRDEGEFGYFLPSHLIHPTVTDAWHAIHHLAKHVLLQHQYPTPTSSFSTSTQSPSHPSSTSANTNISNQLYTDMVVSTSEQSTLPVVELITTTEQPKVSHTESTTLPDQSSVSVVISVTTSEQSKVSDVGLITTTEQSTVSDVELITVTKQSTVSDVELITITEESTVSDVELITITEQSTVSDVELITKTEQQKHFQV